MTRQPISRLKYPTEIPRRRFLRGVGSTLLGLPLLDVFMPRRVHAQSAPATPVFAAFQVEMNGVAQRSGTEPEMFWPTQTGAITTASLAAETDRSLGELQEHADHLTLVRGVSFEFSHSGDPHSGGGNQVLTGHRVSSDPSGNQSLAMGESVDHRIARAIQREEPLGFYAGPKGDYIKDCVSFRGEQDLAVAESNPWLLYTQLIGSGPGGMASELIAKRDQSLNDLVRGELEELLARTDLSMADRERLELHLTSVRDTEQRMLRFMQVDKDHTSDDTRLLVVELQNDLMALALASGYTQVAWFQNGDGRDEMQHTINGEKVPNFHMISHRILSNGSVGEPIPNALELHHQIDRIRLRQFKRFLDTLKAHETPEGNLLDSGFVVYANQQADGAHSYDNVPYIIAGNARGFFKTGQFVDVGGKSNNQLLNTFASAAGVRNATGEYADDMGDPSLDNGVISEIIA